MYAHQFLLVLKFLIFSITSYYGDYYDYGYGFEEYDNGGCSHFCHSTDGSYKCSEQEQCEHAIMQLRTHPKNSLAVKKVSSRIGKLLNAEQPKEVILN